MECFLRSELQALDLTRNFPFEWSELGSNPCASNYPGPEPASEIETDFLSKIINNNSPTAYLTITTFGQYVTYPYHYNK